MQAQEFIRQEGSQQNLLLRVVATPLAPLYRLAMGIRNYFYDRGVFRVRRLPGYVISVGNITVGGTGKSPFVMQLAQHLLDQGAAPAILTRGYKSQLKKYDSVALLDGQLIMQAPSGLQPRADEALMQSKKLPIVPVVVGVKRFEAAKRFVEITGQVPTHWILDDGFQHRKVFRDLDILLVDEANPFGNRRLLPLGPLREPVSSAKRAQVVVFTRASSEVPNADNQRKWQELGDFLLLSAPMATEEIYQVEGQEGKIASESGICAVCAVANPTSFLTSLEKIGVKINFTLAKTDHSRFNLKELKENSVGCSAIITTEKDYWRDQEVFRRSQKTIYVLPMSFSLASNDFSRILEKLPT